MRFRFTAADHRTTATCRQRRRARLEECGNPALYVVEDAGTMGRRLRLCRPCAKKWNAEHAGLAARYRAQLIEEG